MATSMLRLGRLGTLKCLQQDGWGAVRTPLTAAFCTKTETPKKPAKKASSKTLEAPDERAALLAHKTTVAFPTRLSPSGLLSQGVALGEHEQSGKPVSESAAAAGASTVESAPSTSEVSCEAPSKESNTTNTKEAKLVTDQSAKAETESCDVGAAADATPIEQDTSPTSADVEARNNDDASSSSSSSSSDSDSDSDSDDEKPDKTEMTKPVFQTEDKVGREKMPSAVREAPPSDVKTPGVSEHVQPSVPGGFPKGSPAGTPVGSPVETSVGSPVGTSVSLAVGAPKVAFEVCETLSEPTSEKVPASCKAVTSSEEIVDPAPVLCTTESVKLQPKSIPEKEASLELKSSDVSHAIPKPVSKGAPEVAAESTPKVVLDSATEVASEPKLETEAAPETTEAVAAASCKAVTSSEETVDPAPVLCTTKSVKLQPKSIPEKEVYTEAAPETTEAVAAASCKAVTSSEEIVDPAPVLCTTESVKLQPKSIPEKEASLELKSSDVSHAIPKPVSKGAPEVAAESTPKVVLDSATEVASEPKLETEAAPETTEAVAAAEELVDAAPVITEAEEVQAEPDAAAAPEEAPAAPAPEPEPFDNTTYKNLQHHNYNTYTFVDVDVEMAKYRLPQPSTGRPSPKH